MILRNNFVQHTLYEVIRDDFIVDLSFDFEMSGEQFTMPFVINFDWIDIERIAAISRWVSVMSWVAFLISITRKMTLI